MARRRPPERRLDAPVLGRWLARVVSGWRRTGDEAGAAGVDTGAGGPGGAGPNSGAGHGPLPPPLHLAYLGDALWELHVRTRLVAAGQNKLADIHRRAVDQVRAAAQAGRLRAIEAQLTPEEREMVRRGRNASPQGPRSAGAAAYRYSTGFECLLGYLYWTGQVERLHELLERMSDQDEQPAGRGPAGREP